MNSIVRRKYCMRCNREIYTTWRTLDETKYYHPQCFTCADCGVILESVQDHGVATSEDIYCRRCHNDRFAAIEHEQKKSLVVHRTSITTGNTKQRGPAKSKTSYADNMDVIFSSPYSKIREVGKTRMQDDNLDSYIKKKTDIRSDIINLKAKVAGKKKKTNSALLEDALRTFAFAENDCNFNYVQKKSSRIPRPNSATSKKSLTSTTTTAAIPSSLSSTKQKLFKGLVSKSKNSISSSKPPSPRAGRSSSITGAQKMQRSISLMQAKSPGANGGYHVVTPTNKSNKASHGHQRPRSAVSASHAREDKSHKLDNQSAKVSSSFTKRRCAASFEPRKKKENNKGDDRQQAKVSGGNSTTVLKPPAPPYSCGGAIPSTQAILSAIQREGSDLFKIKSTSQIPCMNTESYDIFPAKDIPRVNNNSSGNGNRHPKRSFSFNMTFECPICISSLVPTSSSEKGCLEGRIQLGNVVTPCGHLFHLACMDNWLKIKGNKRCPICSALCLPETLQPVYLECNLCADLKSNSSTSSTERNGFSYYRDRGESKTTSLTGRKVEESDSFRTLRSQYELLKVKYNELVTTNNNGFLNAAIANSLQNAYDAECRNRLQLQWENRKLMMKIEELKMAIEPEPDDTTKLNGFDIPTA